MREYICIYNFESPFGYCAKTKAANYDESVMKFKKYLSGKGVSNIDDGKIYILTSEHLVEI